MSDEGPDDFGFGGGGFCKLYGDRLADSSLLECAVATRWVFLYMLSRADAFGRFRCASVQSLARAAAVSTDEAETAVHELEAPDPHSSSPEEDGRRLVRIPGGWQIVTYLKYRHYQSARQRAEAEKKRRQREAARVGQAADPSPQTPLPTEETSDVRRQILGGTSKDVPGTSRDMSRTPKKGDGAATARELAALEADSELAGVADAWAEAFRRPGRQLGVLRAAQTAFAGGYAADAIKLVVRVVALAREAPERFPDRGSIRWAVEHGKLDPSYLLRPATLDKLIPEAEAWDQA